MGKMRFMLFLEGDQDHKLWPRVEAISQLEEEEPTHME